MGLFQGIQNPARSSIAAEFFPLKGRGAAIMMTRLGWPIGALCATGLQRFVHPISVPQLGMLGQGWRLCLFLSCFPAYTLLLVGLIWMPESPRYYIATGKYDKAFSVLSYLRMCSCRKDKQKMVDEDKKDLEFLLTSQSDKQKQAKWAATGEQHGVGIRSKISTACRRSFP